MQSHFCGTLTLIMDLENLELWTPSRKNLDSWVHFQDVIYDILIVYLNIQQLTIWGLLLLQIDLLMVHVTWYMLWCFFLVWFHVQ